MFKRKDGMSRALVRRETIAGYLFMIPSLLFFLVFVIYPMFMCIYTSFFDSTMGRSEDIFIGFKNYIELFQDPIFLGALRNTDRKSTRLNSSHPTTSRMPSSA